MNEIPATQSRVEQVSDPRINSSIRAQTVARVEMLRQKRHGEVSATLWALSREWDIERVMALNAGVLVCAGSLLALCGKRGAALCTGAVGGLLAVYAVKGRCPLLPVMRRLGVRTAREIAREQMALKALRGDFRLPPQADGEALVQAAERDGSFSQGSA